MLARNGIDNVAKHDQSLGLVERVHHGRGWIGNQQHVALVDGRPSTDAGSIEAKTFLKRAFLKLRDGVGNVLLDSRQIRKTEVELLGVMLLRVIENFFRAHSHSVSPSLPAHS